VAGSHSTFSFQSLDLDIGNIAQWQDHRMELAGIA